MCVCVGGVEVEKMGLVKITAPIYQRLATCQVLCFTYFFCLMLAIALGSFSRNQASVRSSDLPKVTQSGFGSRYVWLELVS